ncbi:hypothetical protein LUZ60_002213 [Juncus effusus]|nr:hypothetical protein LUZ60_002213 [Juncus effusus]
MGKPSIKKKKPSKSSATNSSPKSIDSDSSVFLEMAQELKEDGNKLFQRRDYERALLRYEKALKLLPKLHADVAYLHSNIAACYMQMGPSEYRRAIYSCDLALEVSPKYTKAFLKRARCYEFLERFDLAKRDVEKVLNLEPNNLTALEIFERVKKLLEGKEVELNDKFLVPAGNTELAVVKEKPKKKKAQKSVEKVNLEKEVEKCKNGKNLEDDKFKYDNFEREKCKNITKIPQEKQKEKEEEEEEEKEKEKEKEEEKEGPLRTYKLILGEDIRLAQIPSNCNLKKVREIIKSKYPGLKGLLVKYRDKEGDLVTITTADEFKWVEESSDPLGSIRLFISEGNFADEPLFNEQITNTNYNDNNNGIYIDEWTVEFAKLFKNHVGISCDSYLDLHKIGMKLYNEAIEETVTCEEAQQIFKIAENKFQEMVALAYFNWGNVHMSKARKLLSIPDLCTKDSVLLTKVNESYQRAFEEYKKAESRYNEGLNVKPDFYEGYYAIALQKFELAKLCWYHGIGTKSDLEVLGVEVLEMFNKAEDCMEKGNEIWEGNCKKEILKSNKGEIENLDNMTSQINVFWGSMLYERSIVEFKLGLETWQDCLAVSVEKFRVSGTSETDIAIIIKNHCANETSHEGCGFKIDEIIQLWNEMYDAKRWICGVTSFRLKPLFRRRAPKLHQTFESLNFDEF